MFRLLSGPDSEEMFTFFTEQMSTKAGLKRFKQKGADAITKELEQLVYRAVRHGRDPNTRTREQKQAALKYLMFLKEKRCGKI